MDAEIKGEITSAIPIILTHIEGDREPLAWCNVLPGKHREKRVDFYLTAAVKNSAHEASSSVGQLVSE